MPITYELDAAARSIRTTATGVVTAQDLRGYVTVVAASAGSLHGLKALLDFRHIERFQVTAQTVWELIEIERQAEAFAETLTAIVCADAVLYGMARMYQTLAQGQERAVAVFRTIEDAQFWLEQWRPPEERA